MPIYGSKFWNLGGQKNSTTFWHLKNPKKSALFSPANGQSVTYSKIQTRVSTVPWGPPMDWFLIKSVNAEYLLSCRKCVEKRTFCLLCPAGPPKCVALPQKCYHHIAYIPAHLETPRHFDAPSLLHREKIDFLKTFFWQITQMALESPKIDIYHNWPRRVLGDVKVFWVQIWQKNSNRKCPKLPKRNSHTPCY